LFLPATVIGSIISDSEFYVAHGRLKFIFFTVQYPECLRPLRNNLFLYNYFVTAFDVVLAI
jgi:hypothetical protein